MSENEEICRVLTEEILGKCWHDVHKTYRDLGGLNKEVPMHLCSKCGEGSTSSDISWSKPRNFSDRNQLGELYDAIYKMELDYEFNDFANEKYELWSSISLDNDLYFWQWLFSPARALDTVYPWWINRKENNNGK